MARAEGKCRFDLDDDVVCARRLPRMAADDKETPGPHGIEARKRSADPVGALDAVERDRLGDILPCSDGDEIANRRPRPVAIRSKLRRSTGPLVARRLASARMPLPPFPPDRMLSTMRSATARASASLQVRRMICVALFGGRPSSMTAITTHPERSPSAARHPSRRDTTRLVVAASIGNALEWFDLTAYGYFAVQISKEFFPSGSDAVSLLLAFGTFGVSYLVRPVGAIVLGAYADKAGRKASLLVCIMLMMIGTFMMAFWPNYNSIGIAAPIGILCARLMQGFSVGGEFGSSTAFLVEHDASRKGLLSSFQFSSQGLSNLLGSLFGLVLSRQPQRRATLQAWGWRIPVPVRPADRTGWTIHPQAPRRDAGIRGNESRACTRERAVRRAQTRSSAGDRRCNAVHGDKLSHRLHADLRGEVARPPAIDRFSRGRRRRAAADVCGADHRLLVRQGRPHLDHVRRRRCRALYDPADLHGLERPSDCRL